MKKIRKLFLPVFLAAAMTFSACSLPNSSNSTSVQVDEEGAVTETIIEEKDGDYTEEELTDYIRQSVRRYDAGDESKVSLDSCKISGNSVTIVMKYGSVEDYSGFNQVPCFLGTLKEAPEAGYDISQTWYDEKGSPADASDTEQISERRSEWKIFIISEPVYVRVPDKILYTTGNVTVTGRMTANVDSVVSGKTEDQEKVSVSSASGEQVEASSVSAGSSSAEASSGGTSLTAVSTASDSSSSAGSTSSSGSTSESSTSSGSSSSVSSASSDSLSVSGTSDPEQSDNEKEVMKYVTVADEYAYIIYK